MPSGTILNGVFVPRIHKSNAIMVAEDEAEQTQLIRDQLLALAAYSPSKEEVDLLASEVAEAVDSLIFSAWRSWAAEYITNNPEEVEDELEAVE
jgi:hypothetical protein